MLERCQRKCHYSRSDGRDVLCWSVSWISFIVPDTAWTLRRNDHRPGQVNHYNERDRDVTGSASYPVR